jgi:hypothetical protein
MAENCEHHWFPYWTDRKTYRIEWFCNKCKTWVAHPLGRVGETS